MMDIPFNGFKVSGHIRRCTCPTVLPDLGNTVRQIPLRHLYISKKVQWLKEKCRIISLFSKILTTTELNEKLESVTFENFCSSPSLAKDMECIQVLRRMDRIEFVGCVLNHSFNLVSTLVEKCPNLRSIRGQINMELLKALEPSRRDLIKDLIVEATTSSEAIERQVLPGFFPLKTLTVRWISRKDKTALLASPLESLTASCASTLQVLELRSFPSSLGQLLPNFPPCLLPRLTTVYIAAPDAYVILDQKQWLERIFAAAPSLREIRGEVNPEILAQVIPRNLQACIKHFSLWIRNAAEEQTCVNLANNSKPALEILEIYVRRGPQFYSTIVTVLEKLLEASKYSLTYCYMNVDERLPFAELRMPCMRRLRRLRIWTASMTPEFVKRLKSINYPSCLPSLLELQLYAVPLCETLDNPALVVPSVVFTPCRSYECLTVGTLKLHLDYQIHLKEIEAIFPRVIDLYIGWETPLGTPTPYEQVWTSWPALEDLEIRLVRRIGEEEFNYDHAFCGIHPEEAAALRERADCWELNIVPVRANVSNMKSDYSAVLCYIYGSDFWLW